ncbi:hypothetical protein FQN54_001658 [Arachnomyces sp. PD_36]|nr:hypothetical protein FQN54_001658 [Arachnomyces sp. PD_36]
MDPFEQNPLCCACGLDIPEFREKLSPNAAMSLGNNELFREWEKHFVTPNSWSTTYRVIIKRKKPLEDEQQRQQQQYHLSGIGGFLESDPRVSGKHLTPWNVERAFSVPWGRVHFDTEETHNIGSPKQMSDSKVTVYAANLSDNRNQDLYPHGFPIHAYCWNVIDRIIGPAVEGELDLFVRILQEGWREHVFEVDSSIEHALEVDSSIEPAFEVNSPIFTEDWWADQSKSHELIPESLVGPADPGYIPELRNIVNRAVGETARKRAADSCRDRGHLNLPLDVSLLILDCLGPRDTRNALEGLGWSVPLSYWKSRCPPIIKYVYETKYAKQEDIDWEFFYLEVEELFENKVPDGLRNRQRIFRMLEKTKESYFTRLAQKYGLEN